MDEVKYLNIGVVFDEIKLTSSKLSYNTTEYVKHWRHVTQTLQVIENYISVVIG